MKFIDAIQKYEKITNDGGTTVYSKNSDGTIVMHRNGVGGGFHVNVDLLTSEGWEEYKDNQLILPKRYKHSGVTYFTVSTVNNVYTDVDQHAGIDTERFNTYNYFIDRDLAQYVADKQLLYRIQLVLYAYNKDRMDDDTILKLTNEYIDTYYKEVLDRVLDYQDKI